MKTIKLSKYYKLNNIHYRADWNRFNQDKILNFYITDFGNIMVKIQKEDK